MKINDTFNFIKQKKGYHPINIRLPDFSFKSIQWVDQFVCSSLINQKLKMVVQSVNFVIIICFKKIIRNQ